MQQISKQQLLEMFSSAKTDRFQKSGTFLFRQAEEGETVLTIVSGKLETMKTAGVNEVVLRNIELNSSAESYIIDAGVFKERYDVWVGLSYVVDGLPWGKATARGKVDAYQYKGETIEFDAPWGEKMVCEDGDYIARPVGGSEDDTYRIEKDTFNKTYKESKTEEELKKIREMSLKAAHGS